MKLHANATENPDLFWAARGSGPGFFAVVTRFHLKLHPWPKTAMNSIYLYPVELIEEIFGWADEIGPSVDRSVEMMLFLQRPEHLGGDRRVVGVTGPVLTDSEDQARDALAILETCPVRDQAIAATPFVDGDLLEMISLSPLLFPPGNRFAVDNMWTGRPGRAVAARPAPDRRDPAARALARDVDELGPVARAGGDGLLDRGPHIHGAVRLLVRSGQRRRLLTGWPAERMREMEQLATGIQLADENLAVRPARFVSAENMLRLDEIRTDYDPERLFYEWMGRP